MSLRSRYQNYDHYTSTPARCPPLENGHQYHMQRQSSPVTDHHQSASELKPNGAQDTSNGTTSYGSRLDYIVQSMSYIRGELDDLKESDRVLLDIFKQLENNVEELNNNISSWRLSGSFIGRPPSFTEFEQSNFSSSRVQPDYLCTLDESEISGGVPYSLDSFMDSAKEEVRSFKEETNETDPALVHEVSSVSCSPILPTNSSKFNSGSTSFRSSVGSGTSAAKRSSNTSPQLRASSSFNKLANSPSISRLQDDSGSNMSRNSSIDSGIQFASEVESSSTNGVVEAVVPATSPEDDDNRKSVGFADDIFAALGLNK